MRTLLVTLLCSLAGFGECLPVRGEQITGGDLSAAIPAFEAAKERVVGPAPLAGSERVFLRSELVRVAQRLGLGDAVQAESPSWPESVCFAYPRRPLDDQRVRAALAQLDSRFAGAEILDYSRFPVPAGPLTFHTSAMAGRARSDETRTLRGNIVYAPGRLQPVWVRVRIAANGTRLVARAPLAAGAPVQPDSVESAPGGGGHGSLASLEEVAGLVPRRTIPAGTTLQRTMFRKPPEVVRGQTIDVEVRSGQARLAFSAQAESGGALGEHVLIRSPFSNQRVKVRIFDTGRARLDLTAIAEGRP